MATSCVAFIQNPASLGILTKVAIRSSFRRQSSWRTKETPHGIRLASGKGCDENEVIVMFCVFNCVKEDKLSTTFAHIVQPKHLSSLLRAIDHVVQDSNAPWAEGGVCGFNPKIFDRQHAEMMLVKMGKDKPAPYSQSSTKLARN
nr:hypothetical protein L204_03450 [Cryptococcus depauperatus CBS 7855]